MNAAFFATWKLDKARTENKEAFAKAMQVSDQVFAAIDKLEVTMTISKVSDDTYKFDVNFTGENAPPASSYTATVGTPATVPALDGTQAELTLKIDGAAVIENYKTDKGNFTITRTVSGNEMTAVSLAGDVPLKQFFTKA